MKCKCFSDIDPLPLEGGWRWGVMVEAAREENNVQEQGKWVWREGSHENKSVLAEGGP